MADLTALKRKRSRIKANLTRHGTFINNYEPSKLCEVPIRLSKADELWVEFEKVQDEIEKLCNDEDENNDMREQFQTSFFDIVGRLNMLGIKENTAQPEVQTSTAVSKPEVRLPAIELPTFYGSYKHWSEFLDTFTTLMDANPSLTDIQRFYYLKGALKGSAADVIHSLEVSSSNYKEAWALLRERFENKKLISLSHIESMLNFPNMTRESHSDLRKFVDEVRRDLRALKSLGLGADYWDPLLIYIFEGKLDSVTRKEWQKQSCVNTFATVEELLKFLANKCALLETNLRKQNEHSDKGKSTLRPSTPHTTLKVYSTQRGPRCLFCKSADHYLQSCKKFIDTTVQGKREFITRSGLCWNCLRSGHRVQACTSGTCRHCKGKHHSLLHTDQGNRSETSDRQAADADGDSRDDNDGSRTNTRAAFYGYRDELDMQSLEQVSEVLLSTAIIKLKDNKGDLHDCRALLDCGSQSSLMTREFRDRLDLPMKRTNISILGIGPDVTQITHSVRTTIYSTHTDYKVDTGFLVIDRISNTIPAMNIDISTLNIPNNLVLADASFGKIGKVDVLLGASIFWEILGSERISLGKNKPVIQDTKLGYVVAGQLSLGFGSGTRKSHVQTCNLASTIPVQEQLERFWALEEVGYEKTRTKEEEDCESFFIETTERNQDGRFIVKLPFRTGTPQLGDSLDMASKRFKAMEKKLGKDQESKELYHAFIQEYIDLGHMSVIKDVSQHDHGSSVYYLPHHPVLKKTSQTTKLRVVFDASATSSNGRSLNDHLMVGPKLQDDLIDILLRLRLHTVIITADVEKMFRQVSVATEDRDYQRILWRFNSNEPVSHYRLNTLTYGMASSGYLAVKCMQTLAEGMPDNSEASRIIIRDFYMDDLLTGAQTVEQAKILKEEISQLLAEGGFVLRKWKSNRPEVIATSGQPSVEHYISADNNTSKTLGIRWNAEHDTLNYDCPTEFGCCEIKVTKRQILSLVAQVFDPLGLVAPLVIRAKIILQSLWKENLGWDEEVPKEVLVLWSRLQDEFKKLNEIQIGRQVICECPNEIQLHGFCDASEKAYGACIFIRSVDPLGNFHVHLLCSKSRVAPLKVISLPRLELCGALLLAKLTHAVLQSTALQPSVVRLWTDSSIVLCWLAREPSAWTTFVANRTSKVQHLTQGNQWSHVSSEDNPADLVSRGADCYSLQLNSLWWKGPWWLSRHQEHWPRAERIDVKDVPDQRRVHQVFVGSNLSHVFERFSNFNRLHRAIAYCTRFIKNSRVQREHRQAGALTVDELGRAWIIIIKIVQEEEFGSEMKFVNKDNKVNKASKLAPLCPFRDSNGLVRVGGRLAKADLSYDQKFPVILPSKHKVTRLIVLHEHYKHLHAGPQALLARIRLQYWPISGRQTVRSVLKRCIVCFRAKPKDFRQYMGELPRSRVTACRPFSNSGVDYAGPFYIRAARGRGYATTKAYLCVFVCFATKAVHLELVADLTTQSFLNCFKRFISRRGLFSNIYSDNATKFTGANHEIQDLYRFLQDEGSQKAFSEYFAGSSIRWHFIPPRSPHFGGLWESAVRSAKYHLKRVVGGQTLTFDELYTVLTQVECCLNSRPLTPLSDDPEDLEVLTPGHFLIGGSPFALPQEDLSKFNPNRLQRYHLLTQLIQSFWKKWHLEYLSQLQQRQKWRVEGDSIKVGDMVLVREDNLPPMKWPLGRVIALHPGTDNRCRVVSIKTSNNVLKRASTQVCILPIESSSD